MLTVYLKLPFTNFLTKVEYCLIFGKLFKRTPFYFNHDFVFSRVDNESSICSITSVKMVRPK